MESVERSLEERSDNASDISDDEISESGIWVIHDSLVDCINNLNRMSLLVRNPTPRDRLVAIKDEDIAQFTLYDRQHASNKFPDADASIVDRLGSMISNCRAVIKYRQTNYTKLGGVIGSDLDTNRSSVYGKLLAFESESDAESLLGVQSSAIPPRPKESAVRNRFRCPYCFYTVCIRNDRQWRKHVLSDLTPYTCIFPACNTPGRIYNGRRDLVSHLIHKHGDKLAAAEGHGLQCPLCHESNLQEPDAEKHLGTHLEGLALFALPSSDPEASMEESAGPTDVDMQDLREEQEWSEGAVMDDPRNINLVAAYLYICVWTTNIPIVIIG